MQKFTVVLLVAVVGLIVHSAHETQKRVALENRFEKLESAESIAVPPGKFAVYEASGHAGSFVHATYPAGVQRLTGTEQYYEPRFLDVGMMDYPVSISLPVNDNENVLLVGTVSFNADAESYPYVLAARSYSGVESPFVANLRESVKTLWTVHGIRTAEDLSALKPQQFAEELERLHNARSGRHLIRLAVNRIVP